MILLEGIKNKAISEEITIKRIDVYNEVQGAFTRKYSWLGAQFSKEFLESCASWNIQQFSKPDFRLRKHIALFWEPAWIKTVIEDTKILTPTGYNTLKSLKNIDEIVTIQNGEGIKTKAFKSPLKKEKCIEINTTARYQVIAGIDHPFRVITKEGNLEWIKSKDLKIGDTLIMSKPDITTNRKNKLNNVARFIGYLIGDGCYCNKNVFGFTNCEPEILSDYNLVLTHCFPDETVKTYIKNNKMRSKDIRIYSKEARIKLKEIYGLGYVKSGDKTIPEMFIAPNREILENLLFGLYQTDGSVRTNGITFSSTSQKLLGQIQEILLLLGVDSHRVKHEIRVLGWKNLSKLPLICNESKHRERIKLIVNRRNPATEIIPHASKMIINKLKERKSTGYNNSIRKQCKKYNIPKENLYSKPGKNKEHFKEMCDKIGEPDLKWLASDEIFFDTVKEKKEVGVKKCYDLFVPLNNQFISNGFLTHNSTLLKKAYEILGDQLCIVTSDITVASIRGTVDFGKFVPPYTLIRPFSVATEFGQVVGTGKEEMVQKLLNILEEGMVSVSLSKISSLSPEQRAVIESEYPQISFIEKNTFSYRTNWILMVATYNRKFMIDNAFESRFSIVVPEQPLTSELTKFIKNAPPWDLPLDVVDAFRDLILDDSHIMDCNVDLPSELFESEIHTITPRQCALLSSYKLTNEWWGRKVTDEEIMERAGKLQNDSEAIWKTVEDKVFDLIVVEEKTFEQIKNSITPKVTDRAIYYALNKLRPAKILKDKTVYYRVM